jgi:hypothetical protein
MEENSMGTAISAKRRVACLQRSPHISVVVAWVMTSPIRPFQSIVLVLLKRLLLSMVIQAFLSYTERAIHKSVTIKMYKDEKRQRKRKENPLFGRFQADCIFAIITKAVRFA